MRNKCKSQIEKGQLGTFEKKRSLFVELYEEDEGW